MQYAAHNPASKFNPSAMTVAHRLTKDAADKSNMEKATVFGAANADIMDWLFENAETEFGKSLAHGLNTYGSLTERQCAAVRAKLGTLSAPVVSVERIELAFMSAKAKGIKRPRMNLDTFKFKPAKESSANPGAIYVTEDGQYLGKVMGGKFLKVSACDDDTQTRVIAAASDPMAAAKAYGQRTGDCAICGRELTAEESIARFIGPVCAAKYGI